MTAPEREYPADAVLLNRGRYATLGAERRNHLKLLRDDVHAITTYCRTILNAAQEPNERTTFVQEEVQLCEERLRAAKLRVAALAVIEPQLEALRPLAWGKAKLEE